MKKRILSLALLSLVMVTSCNKDEVTEDNLTQEATKQEINPELQINTDFNKSQEIEISENLGDIITNKAVEPSECGPTSFQAVQREYITPLLSDQLALNYYGLYLNLNFYYSYFFDGDQYFGEDGEATLLMAKQTRDLEDFWDVEGEISVRGQHTATLNDREKLADLYEIVGVEVNTREDAYAVADQILAINEASPNLPENPFFATDGFATTNQIIVIGDGLVEMLSKTGVDSDIVWTGILAHEWAHQVQFSNYTEWYPNGAAKDPAESTRFTELEADFLSAYYMTHKRGATYNWKRVEQFYELFFQIGDCGFDNPGHHGTPLQRLAATEAGFELANDAKKKGKILSQEEAHQAFLEIVEDLL